MAVKYHCPKCEGRYVEWGAQKLGFMCPHCEGQTLIRSGASAAAAETAPALRRRPKKVEPTAPAEEEDGAEDFEGIAEDSEDTEQEDSSVEEKDFVDSPTAPKTGDDAGEEDGEQEADDLDETLDFDEEAGGGDTADFADD